MVEIFSGAVVSIADSVAPVDNATMALQFVRKIPQKGLVGRAEILEVTNKAAPICTFRHPLLLDYCVRLEVTLFRF